MKQGIALSVGASFLFAVIYYYATLLQPMTGTELFAWRIVLGIPALALLITQLRAWDEIKQVGLRLINELRFFLFMLLCALLFGIQMWLFVWAPVHNKALDVSLGYFLLPLTMVVAGRVVYKEKLSRLQKIAVGFAVLGVLHEFGRNYSFSWATALVAFGYPPYFMLRRHLRLGALTGLWFDFSFLFVPTLYVLFSQEVSLKQTFLNTPHFFWQVPLFGLLSSIALAFYLSSSRLLPLGLFGLLGYVEPILLFWVAFLLIGEPIQPGEWWTYIPIWIAVGIVVSEIVWQLYKDWRCGRLVLKS
ncbi:EamA family transporter RarD [Paenalcaligenes hominis]|uniref:EamA family transporter RarD n=1 Tax=Paenalcaligenes hominis TaxID=643674 RepID=UPI003523225A